MELQYNLLWFEDAERYVTPQLGRIRKYLDDLGGFVLDSIIEENADNLKQLLDENEFDLILVDMNLSPGKSGKIAGDVLIQMLRENKVYTDIIFYSRIPGFRDKKYELQGVYFADTDNDNLYQKIKEIIHKTLQRNLRISITRGLFIATTIDLVEKMEEIISKILKLSDDQLTFFQDYVVEAEFFNDSAKYTIIKDFLNREMDILNQKIKTPGGEEEKKLIEKRDSINQIKSDFNKFQKDVIETRNHLAHAKPVPGKKNTLKVRIKQKRCYEDWTFDLSKCKEIRKKFLAHDDTLKKISSLLR